MIRGSLEFKAGPILELMLLTQFLIFDNITKLSYILWGVVDLDQTSNWVGLQLLGEPKFWNALGQLFHMRSLAHNQGFQVQTLYV